MIKEAVYDAGLSIAVRSASIIGNEVGERLPLPPVGKIMSRIILSQTNHQIKLDALQEEFDYSTDVHVDDIAASCNVLKSGKHN